MIDFERASLLMHVIVEAGKHGPLYQRLAAKASEELKQMIATDEAEGHDLSIDLPPIELPAPPTTTTPLSRRRT